jgi:hypothetical protein
MDRLGRRDLGGRMAMSTMQQVPRPDVRTSARRTPKKMQPSRGWYALGAAIAVAGLIVGLVWGFTTYSDYRDEIQGFARMQAPGTTALVLDAGPQTIYFEGSSATTPIAANLDVTSAEGSNIPTSPYVGDVRYDAPDGSVGKAIASIVVPAPGTYRVVVDGTPGTLAIGPAVTSSIIVGVIGALFLTFGSLATGIAVVVVVAVARSNARRRMGQMQN